VGNFLACGFPEENLHTHAESLTFSEEFLTFSEEFLTFRSRQSAQAIDLYELFGLWITPTKVLQRFYKEFYKTRARNCEK
jgi:hypothetical protein